MFKNLKIIVSVYLILGGIISIYVLSTSIEFLLILQSLRPYLVSVITILFFILAGITNLRKDSRNFRLLQIALLIQAFQIILFGFTYINYYGPYAGFGISIDRDLTFTGKVRLMDIAFANGYKKDSSEIFLQINLVFFFLYYILTRLKRKAEKVENFSFEKE